jgi:hypothetical protein
LDKLSGGSMTYRSIDEACYFNWDPKKGNEPCLNYEYSCVEKLPSSPLSKSDCKV